jgi:hypothetical protein
MMIPANIQQLSDTVIAKAELRYLRHKDSYGRLRKIATILTIALLLCIAYIPFGIYVGFGQSTLLKIITGTVVLAHAWIGWRAVTLASQAIAREKQSQTWESLILTGISARQIIVSKWWSCVRCLSLEYIFVGLLKIGLAYGLAQYFYLADVYGCSWFFGTSMCRSISILKWNPDAGANTLIIANPPLYGVVAGALVLIVFSLLELGLLVALGIATTMLAKQHQIGGLILTVIVRSLLIFMVLLSWLGFNAMIQPISNARWFYIDQSQRCCAFRYEIGDSWYDDATPEKLHAFLMGRAWQDLLETAQLSIAPLGDTGVLLATDMMRPRSSHLHFIYRVESLAVALILYALCLWASLRLGVIAAVRRGAISH